MTLVGWILGALAAIFGGLVVRDLRARDAGLVFFTLRRSEQPVTYWALIAFEGVIALLCALLAIVALLYPSDCDANGVCTVTIPAQDPAA